MTYCIEKHTDKQGSSATIYAEKDSAVYFVLCTDAAGNSYKLNRYGYTTIETARAAIRRNLEKPTKIQKTR